MLENYNRMTKITSMDWFTKEWVVNNINFGKENNQMDPYKYPSIHIYEEVSSLNVYPGQTVTIWLNYLPKDFPDRDAVQVELRVKEDGKIEIFSHTDKVQLKDFNQWYSINPEIKESE